MDNNVYTMAFIFVIVAIEILWGNIKQNTRNKKIKNRDSKNYNLKNPRQSFQIPQHYKLD